MLGSAQECSGAYFSTRARKMDSQMDPRVWGEPSFPTARGEPAFHFPQVRSFSDPLGSFLCFPDNSRQFAAQGQVECSAGNAFLRWRPLPVARRHAAGMIVLSMLRFFPGSILAPGERLPKAVFRSPASRHTWRTACDYTERSGRLFPPFDVARSGFFH